MAESEVVRLVREAKEQQRRAQAYLVESAVSLLDGQSVDVVRGELHTRMPEAMGVDTGMSPVPVPLLKRFADESASVYGKPVHRELVTKDGETNDQTEEQTKKLTDWLEESGFDERMHLAEKLMHALAPSPPVLWWQQKRGLLWPQIILPSRIAPVVSSDTDFMMDETDPLSYDAFAVELGAMADVTDRVARQTSAIISAAQVVIVKGVVNPPHSTVDDPVGGFPNRYTWPQVVDSENPDGTVTPTSQELPLLPLTFLHKRDPIDHLIPSPGLEVYYAEIEISIALTVIFHWLQMQGFAVPVFTSPSAQKGSYKWGPMFPLNLDADESFQYVTSSLQLSELLNAPMSYTRLTALLESLSANDFSIDGQSPTSGFAKLIDSLPKIEARKKMIRRFTRMERQHFAPQMISIGVGVGRLDEIARTMKLRTTFEDIKPLESVDERNSRLDFDLKHHLTSPARILAERDGISIEEAEERIAKIRSSAPPTQQPPGPASPPGLGGLFGSIARQRPQQQRNEDEDGEQPRRPPPR